MHATHEILDHTADTGIRAWGDSWEDLLVNAARGFYAVLLDDPSRIRAGEVTREVRLEGEDRVDLVVEWLGELLYLFDVDRVLFGRFDFEEASERLVVARLRGEELAADRHEVETEIKAVTYHEATVEESRGRWETRVIFDL